MLRLFAAPLGSDPLFADLTVRGLVFVPQLVGVGLVEEFDGYCQVVVPPLGWFVRSWGSLREMVGMKPPYGAPADFKVAG